MGQYYSLMTLLPPVPAALGEKMPMGFGEISAMVKRNIFAEHLELTFAHLNVVDAFNWEQMDQGRDLFLDGGIVSKEDMANGRNLPDFIRVFNEEKERGVHLAYPYDRLWELYYTYALNTAERFNCRFLIDYLTWEIELRSDLTAMRVREKGGNIDDHAIMKTMRPRDFSNLVAQLGAQKNPLQVERLLDEERLRQIYLFEGVYGFSIDALLAYVSRSSIYSRWEKISEDFDIEAYLWHGGTM